MEQPIICNALKTKNLLFFGKSVYVVHTLKWTQQQYEDFLERDSLIENKPTSTFLDLVASTEAIRCSNQNRIRIYAGLLGYAESIEIGTYFLLVNLQYQLF